MEESSGRESLLKNNLFSGFAPAEPEPANGDIGEDDQLLEVRTLVNHIEQKDEQLVPIISNSMRIDWILDVDFNRKVGARRSQIDIKMPELSGIEQEFAQFWAESFKDDFPFGIPRSPISINSLSKDYPEINTRTDDELVAILIELVHAHEKINRTLKRVAEYNHLARVAQYRQIIPDDDNLDPDLSNIRTLANSQYLKFLKGILYEIAKHDPYVSKPLVEELGVGPRDKKLIDQYSFSDLAQDLGYPRFNTQYPDLLRKLAKLPLPIYITTSYFDFLQRLLQAEGKKPQTQICFYKGEPATVPPRHKTRDIIPSVTHPVVFHLYGYEKYPSSIVLSEADYLEFLTVIANDNDSKAPIVPLYIREALTESAVLILGYRLLSWDFRILFRSLLNREGQKLRRDNVALQIDPKFEEAFLDDERALSYIRQYFKSARFSLAVGNTVEFVEALWKEWERRQ